MMIAGERTVTRLVEALATGDRRGLEEVLAREVQLRALLPGRYLEVTGPAGVADVMLGWFAGVAGVVPLHRQVDLVGDTWRAGYRFAIRGGVPEQVVEQHAYCTLADGSITVIRLICSGFRPVPAAGTSRTAPAGTSPAEPEADRHIEALGEGCATLTPRISAALRGMAPGEVLAVLTDDPSAPDGIAAWSRLTGHAIAATAAGPGGTRFYLRHA